MKKVKNAFTLIELMVVISVIAILATIALFGFGKAQASARDVGRQQMMVGVQTALERYYGDKGHYPLAGDAVPGGTVQCCNNFFNGMMTNLNQNGYLDITIWKDPRDGLVYSTFGGADRFVERTGWTWEGVSRCGGSGAYYNDFYTTSPSSVRYGYYTPDGQSYLLCLEKESGGYSTFKSPQ